MFFSELKRKIVPSYKFLKFVISVGEVWPLNIYFEYTRLHHKTYLFMEYTRHTSQNTFIYGKVQVGKDQEKAQSEKDSHSKNRGGKKPN